MAVGLRKVSIGKSAAARISANRIARQKGGIKLSKGFGTILNPARGLTNFSYKTTTRSLFTAGKTKSKSGVKTYKDIVGYASFLELGHLNNRTLVKPVPFIKTAFEEGWKDALDNIVSGINSALDTF